VAEERSLRKRERRRQGGQIPEEDPRIKKGRPPTQEREHDGGGVNGERSGEQRNKDDATRAKEDSKNIASPVIRDSPPTRYSWLWFGLCRGQGQWSSAMCSS
jgi:hypothetical protein